MKKSAKVFLFLILAVLFLSAGPALSAEAPASETPGAATLPVGLGTFDEILFYLQEVHLSRPDSGTLLQGAIEGMLQSTGDPYTEYFPPADLKEFEGALEGDFVGVGIQLQPTEAYPVVSDVLRDTPASKAGIRPGDLVLEVDGVDVAGQPLGEVVQKIRGLEGTKILLTLRRQGVEDFEIELTRANIDTPTVSAKLLENKTGYILIQTFGNSTAAEFKKSLQGLIRQGAGQVILDLRDNPGGTLQAAMQIAGNFLDRGRLVVSTVDRDGNRKDYYTEETPLAPGMKVVVLVNENSASASEILAGALQDHGAASVAGATTYGKATVQIVIPLEAGGALKVTMARYHTPKDKVIQGAGLSPDLQVLVPELQLIAAQRLFKPLEKRTIRFETGKPGVSVDGAAVQLEKPVLTRPEGAYLPLRFVFEALGYRVDWLTEARRVKMSGLQPELLLDPFNGWMTVGGRPVTVAEPPLFDEGALYIPVSTLRLLGIQVEEAGGYISIEK